MIPLKHLYLYLTDSCNLKCLHCFQNALVVGSYLKFEDCKDFLDQSLELGLSSVTLSGGEPLLSPDFDLFLEYFFHAGSDSRSRRMACLSQVGGCRA